MDTLENIIELLKSKAKITPPAKFPPSIDDIIEIQNQFDFTFTEDFNGFLKTTIGLFYGKVQPGTVSSNPVFTSLNRVILNAQEYGVPNDVIPFCEDNANFYCLTETGEVRFWSHDGSGFNDEVWENLASWIQNVWILGN